MAYGWTTTNALASLAASAMTWTAGPADDTRLYLRDRRMGKQYVCTAASSGNEFTFDLGSAQALKGIALLNHNLASFGGTVTCQVLAADDSGFTTNLVTAKNVTTLDFTRPHEKDFVVQFASVTRRWWKMLLTWTGTKTLKVGEVFAYSSVTTLSRRDIYGKSGETREIRTVDVESDSLERTSYLLAGPRRSKRLSFSDLSESERQELEALFESSVGPVNPVLFVTDVNETATASSASEQDVLFAKLDLDTFAYDFTDFGRYKPPDFVLRNLAREVGA